MRKSFLILFISCIFVLSSAVVFAGTMGGILGFITSDDGSPVSEATITVVERGLQVVSNEFGMFSIQSLRPGIYTLEIKKAGYGSVIVEKVSIQINLTTSFHITLQQTDVNIDPIIVTASKILIHREQTGTVYQVDHDEIIEMSSRDIFRVALAMPGVISNEDGQFKIRGSRYDQTLFMIDGLSIMDPFWKTFGATPNALGIMGEISVITGGFDAEYGDALGGIVNAVTRNPNLEEHHGSFVYNTSDIPNYHGMWDNSIKLGEEEFEIDMDGPLTKDIGYVFAAQVFLADASTTSGYKNYKYEEFHDYHFKLSYNLSPKTNLMYHTNYGFAWIRLSSSYVGTWMEDGWPIQKQFNRWHHLIIDTYVGNATTATIAYGWFWSGIDYGAHDEDEDGNILWNEIRPLLELQPGDYYANQRTRSTTQEFKIDIKSTIDNQHTLKYGTAFQHVYLDMFWTVSYGMYWWDTIEYWPAFAYLEDWEDSYDYTSAYVQDKFALIPDKLTLTTGIRYEDWGFLLIERTKISPRFGISYQLDDYTVIRTNYSQMYQAPNVSAVLEYDSGGIQDYFWGEMSWGSDTIVPQSTSIIEFGLQRQLGKDFILEINAYNKQMDKIHCVWENPKTYKVEYVNGGEGWAQGVEFTLRKTLSKNVKGWVNYSWMIAKGKNIARDFYNSDSVYEYPELYDKEYYLSWDQRHNVNVNLFYSSDNFFINVIWRWGSGYPYTPHDRYHDWGVNGRNDDSGADGIPDTWDSGEGDGVENFGEVWDYGEQDGAYQEGEPTWASNIQAVYNTKRYPSYDRVDVITKFKMKNLKLLGAEYWISLTVRNLFDHHNLRQRGGNDPADINPYTGEPWTRIPTGGTTRRVVMGIEATW
ncbi:TonB-dependent receptor [Candidatus Dependentiae bacterium]|nr:TonB-dependent receptor [Candidatus Dependentiae bacterium]